MKYLLTILVFVASALMINISQAEDDVNVTGADIKAGIKGGMKYPDFKVSKEMGKTLVKRGIVVKADDLAKFKNRYDLSSSIAEETENQVVICGEVDIGPVCVTAQCVSSETGEPTGQSGQCCWSIDEECNVVDDHCECTEISSEMVCTGC